MDATDHIDLSYLISLTRHPTECRVLVLGDLMMDHYVHIMKHRLIYVIM